MILAPRDLEYVGYASETASKSEIAISLRQLERAAGESAKLFGGGSRSVSHSSDLTNNAISLAAPLVQSSADKGLVDESISIPFPGSLFSMRKGTSDQLGGLANDLTAASDASRLYHDATGSLVEKLRESSGIAGHLGETVLGAFGSMLFGGKELSQVLPDVFRGILGAFGVKTDGLFGGGGGGGASGIASLFGGGGDSGAGIASLFGGITSLFGFANGGAFSGGRVIPMAAGGVVAGPTAFPMAGGAFGLMGEAGPEAILPLRRDSSGNLGVSMTPPAAALRDGDTIDN